MSISHGLGLPDRFAAMGTVREIETPQGVARAHVQRPPRGSTTVRGSLLLGHGAGGGIEANDLRLLTSLTVDGWAVVRVEQPWRVAGKRVATASPTLDDAWVAVVEALSTGRWKLASPLVSGGRSAGARVACRTAETVGAYAVLALSFPLHPPGKPEKSRAHEASLVTAAGRALAVVQGRKDPFGTPDEIRTALGPEPAVYEAAGNHGFSRDPSDVLEHARTWLATL